MGEMIKVDLTTLPFHLSINVDYHARENKNELEQIMEVKVEYSPYKDLF